MNIGLLFLLASSAAFLAGLQCASTRTTAWMDPPSADFNSTAGGGGGSSGETGGKKDSNQTLNSRMKRKTLAVDFAVPSLLRSYLEAFVKRPLNGDCQTFSGCYTRPLSKVLNLSLTKASRKSNQVVVEIGEDIIRMGCGGLSVYEEAPVFTLEMDLTTILEWWLGAQGGRLRVRLMPEKKAQVPGVEDRYTAAIRAADPRLFFQISSRGLCWTELTMPAGSLGCKRRKQQQTNEKVWPN
ncbi:unnamed protein product [Tetraodon nigroviridis]|uniref:(spotted green pufferfish) hypothetical protein n=1 Tax=Tetraodon nigroviridis TaxID=99883 RepID=Q4SK10_TETNG|nr:unnamed protein product [Tetraodon nigroviridis]